MEDFAFTLVIVIYSLYFGCELHFAIVLEHIDYKAMFTDIYFL